jgi:uncharacterized protein
VPMMMAALSMYHAGLQQIVIVGQADGEDMRALAHAVAARYLPFAVVVPVAPGERQAQLADLLPFVGSMTLRDGRATAYVCRAFTCRAPVTAPEALAAQLEG